MAVKVCTEDRQHPPTRLFSPLSLTPSVSSLVSHLPSSHLPSSWCYCHRGTRIAEMSNHPTAEDSLAVRVALGRCNGGSGCVCPSHLASPLRSPAAGSPSRSRSTRSDQGDFVDSSDNSSSDQVAASKVYLHSPFLFDPRFLLPLSKTQFFRVISYRLIFRAAI